MYSCLYKDQGVALNSLIWLYLGELEMARLCRSVQDVPQMGGIF